VTVVVVVVVVVVVFCSHLSSKLTAFGQKQDTKKLFWDFLTGCLEILNSGPIFMQDKFDVT